MLNRFSDALELTESGAGNTCCLSGGGGGGGTIEKS